MSQLINIIEKLSKSSPNAVYTPKGSLSYDSHNFYDYLYVETQIEKEYKELLANLKDSKNIVFLCGSSGDGKSAIIGKNAPLFEKYYDIHIDATHSFKPDQSAIEALNNVFDHYKKNTRSLIVGINMGILLNYAREGSDKHDDIKKAINNYDLNATNFQNIYFLNFENYPKFEIYNEHITSTFIYKLLKKITIKSDKNPFYNAYINDLKNDIYNIEHKNYYLLKQSAIQNSIVELLVTVHLKYDQFLTTRGILDLIYQLLNGPKLLIDQLFENNSNSILKNIRKEDPVLIRTKQLDTFILERSNKKKDVELQLFIDNFNYVCKTAILLEEQPHTLIRTFFLFKNQQCSTNYHNKFSQDFHDTSTVEYIHLILANKKYDNENKAIIQKFYKEIKNAILAYANKQRPILTRKGLFQFDNINRFSICAELDISPDIKNLQKETSHAINSFKCYLKVDEESISPIVITLNMYKMILAINQGYRPNKHDRNTIILFEELIEKISQQVKKCKKLIFIENNNIYTFKKNNEEIEVSTNAY